MKYTGMTTYTILYINNKLKLKSLQSKWIKICKIYKINLKKCKYTDVLIGIHYVHTAVDL